MPDRWKPNVTVAAIVQRHDDGGRNPGPGAAAAQPHGVAVDWRLSGRAALWPGADPCRCQHLLQPLAPAHAGSSGLAPEKISIKNCAYPCWASATSYFFNSAPCSICGGS